MDLKKDKLEAIKGACSIDKIDPNKFISKELAYYKVLTRLESSGDDVEAAFLINLDSLETMLTKIKEFNDKGGRQIEGIRVWKGLQNYQGVNCLEDLVLEPVDGQGNDIHYFGDEPKTDDGEPLILSATRPCPHLCGSGTPGQYRFFTGMSTPISDNPYETCSIIPTSNNSTEN